MLELHYIVKVLVSISGELHLIVKVCKYNVIVLVMGLEFTLLCGYLVELLLIWILMGNESDNKCAGFAF